MGNVEKNKRRKLDKDIIKRNEIMQEIQKSANDFLLPEMKKKVEEVSQFVEERLDKGKLGLTAAQILPLIARRSLADMALAGHYAYTVQELSVGFDLYIQMLQKINEYTRFPPSKQSFCLFMGISTYTYNNYLQDPEKCEIMRIIDDYITTNKLTSAELGEIKEISTMFELKAQHGWVEASAPVVIKHETKSSMEDIKAKIASIKGKVIDAEFEEKENRQSK